MQVCTPADTGNVMFNDANAATGTYNPPACVPLNKRRLGLTHLLPLTVTAPRRHNLDIIGAHLCWQRRLRLEDLTPPACSSTSAFLPAVQPRRSRPSCASGKHPPPPPPPHPPPPPPSSTTSAARSWPVVSHPSSTHASITTIQPRSFPRRLS